MNLNKKHVLISKFFLHFIPLFLLYDSKNSSKRNSDKNKKRWVFKRRKSNRNANEIDQIVRKGVND